MGIRKMLVWVVLVVSLLLGSTSCQLVADRPDDGQTSNENTNMMTSIGELSEEISVFLTNAAADNSDFQPLAVVWGQVSAGLMASMNMSSDMPDPMDLADYFAHQFTLESIPDYMKENMDFTLFFRLWEEVEQLFLNMFFPPSGSGVVLDADGWFEVNEQVVKVVSDLIQMKMDEMRNRTRNGTLWDWMEMGMNRSRNDKGSGMGNGMGWMNRERRNDTEFARGLQTIIGWLAETFERTEYGNWTKDMLSSEEAKQIMETVTDRFMMENFTEEDLWAMLMNSSFIPMDLCPGAIGSPKALEVCMMEAEKLAWEAARDRMRAMYEKWSTQNLKFIAEELPGMIDATMPVILSLEKGDWCPLQEMLQNMTEPMLNNITGMFDTGMFGMFDTMALQYLMKLGNLSVSDVLESNSTALRYIYIGKLFVEKSRMAANVFQSSWTPEEVSLIEQTFDMDFTSMFPDLSNYTAVPNAMGMFAGMPVVTDLGGGFNSTSTAMIALSPLLNFFMNDPLATFSEIHCSNFSLSNLLMLNAADKVMFDEGFTMMVKGYRAALVITRAELTKPEAWSPVIYTPDELEILNSTVGPGYLFSNELLNALTEDVSRVIFFLTSNDSAPYWENGNMTRVVAGLISDSTNHDIYERAFQMFLMMFNETNMPDMGMMMMMCPKNMTDEDGMMMASICNGTTRAQNWMMESENMEMLARLFNDISQAFREFNVYNSTLTDFIPTNNYIKIDDTGAVKINAMIAQVVWNVTMQGQQQRTYLQNQGMDEVVRELLRNEEILKIQQIYRQYTGRGLLYMIRTEESLAQLVDAADCMMQGKASVFLNDLLDNDNQFAAVAYELSTKVPTMLMELNRTMGGLLTGDMSRFSENSQAMFISWLNKTCLSSGLVTGKSLYAQALNITGIPQLLNAVNLLTRGESDRKIAEFIDVDQNLLTIAVKVAPHLPALMEEVKRTALFLYDLVKSVDKNTLMNLDVDNALDLLKNLNLLTTVVPPEMMRDVLMAARYVGTLMDPGSFTMSSVGIALSKMDFGDAFYSAMFESSAAQFLMADTGFSPGCLGDLMLYSRSLPEGRYWAMKMLDATAKIPAGFFDGATHWVGSYDQCVGINASQNTADGGEERAFGGQYCSALIQLMGADADGSIPTVLQQARVGLCVPSSCSSEEIRTAITMFGADASDVACHLESPAEREEFKTDTFAIAMTVVIALMGGIVFFFTMIDCICLQPKECKARGETCDRGEIYMQKESDLAENDYVSDKKLEADPDSSMVDMSSTDKTKTGSLDKFGFHNQPIREAEPERSAGVLLIKGFSVWNNLSIIMNTERKADTIKGIDCIRFLSMAWIILGHTYFFSMAYPPTQRITSTSNLFSFIMSASKEYNFQVILSAHYAVDTFLLLSGLLATYLYLKKLDKFTFQGRHLILYYVRRVWRLSPYYLFFILGAGAFDRYLGEGPMAVGTWDDNRVGDCRNGWWTNIAYINNFFDQEDTCIPWSWYLAVDMQLSFLAPIVIIAMAYAPVFAGILMGAALCSHIVTNAYMYQDGPEGFVAGSEDWDFFARVYIKPYSRVGPYVVGMFLGLALHKKWTLGRSGAAALAAALLWILSMGIIWLYVFVPFNEYQHMTEGGMPEEGRWSSAAMAGYHFLARIAFSSAVAWVVYAINNGMGGWMTGLFHWSGWTPLARLTFGAYLIHPLIMIWYTVYLRQLTYCSNLTMITLFPSFLCFSYAGSLVTSLFFEWPFAGIEKAVLKACNVRA